MPIKPRVFVLVLALTSTLSVGAEKPDASTSESDDPKALMKQAAMYLHGRGVEANVDRAISIYHGLAERDVAFAQYRLAQLYLEGKIVPLDHAQALTWLQRAAGLGFVDAQLELSRLYETGQGTAQDYVSAHKWLHIAASLAELDIEERQQALEDKMSFWQLTRAKYLARRCIYRKYENC